MSSLDSTIIALLGDPSADLSGSGCPVELSLLRDRIQSDTHAHYQRQIEQIRKEHELELSSVRTAHDSSNHYEGVSQKEKWRQKRNNSFDKNRHLEEVTKERDGLAQLSRGLQRVLRQLVLGSFSACEDEVNNTLLEELLKQHLDFTSSSDSTLDQEPQSSNTSLVEPTQSSKRPSVGKRVHFAPDVDSIISQFNPEFVLDNIEKQADVSIEIKNELDICLNRLRQEAQDLLTISSKVGNERPIGKTRLSDAYGAGDFETQKPESDTAVLKEEIESFKNRICKLDCDKKELEEAIKEGLHRESLLRDELKLTLSRVAEYANDGEELPKSGEVITEGYGICPTARPGRPPRTPRLVQSPQTPQTPRTPRSDSRHHSLDSVVHGQYYAARTQDLNAELDAVTKERDDFAKQLEAANRFLLSTRKFLEDQTTEWESERDQYLKGLNQLKEENARLNVKLQSNDIINAEMAQIETQVREKNTFIADLENRKAEVEANLKTAMEKVTVLREIICNLEAQLEEKGDRETNLIEDLEQLRLMSDAKDCRIRDLQDEYDTLKLEMYRKTAIAADKDESSGESESTDQKLITTIRTQLESLEATVMKRTSALERLYDRCPHSNSEPSEDLSLADHRQRSSVSDEAKMDQAPEVLRADIPVPSSPRRLLYRLSEGLARHYRAEEAALKRIRDLEMQLSQLRDVAQEVRLERDALQQRLSEQALRVSSLQARLDAQRHAADALRRDVQDKAAIQLNDANAELQATKEALEKREKQLARLKNSQDTSDVDSVEEDRPSLQRQLAEVEAENEELKANLESANAGERTDDELMLLLLAEKNADIELLKEHLAEKEQLLFHREQQLNELMALKLDEDQPREESENEANKNSARTLSDIISLSEYDQSDLQIRKAEIRHQDTSNIFLQLSGNGKSLNQTLPPKNIEQVEFAKRSPRFDRAVNLTRDSKHGDGVHSLPILDTTANARVGNKSASLLENYKRNVNETVLFGVSLKSDKHSTGHQVDNSLLPNLDASQKKQVLIEPKRINFSVPSTHDDLIDQSPKLILDYEQKVFPDVLTQLKHEIRRLSAELEEKKAALDAAQVQLLLFDAVQTELEEVRGLLQDSVKTVEADKKFYNDQIENFSAVEKDLKKRLEYAIIQANEKASDLQLLKQDILKRENMVLELAKEKRIVQQRLDEMELKLEVLQNKADLYESACTENERMRAKLQDHQNKDDIISEKNIQIDSLNEHLDRLDNFQRELEEKDEQLKALRTELQGKSNEIEQLNENVANLTNKEVILSTENKSLKENMSKLEKEQENIAMKEQAIEKREKDIEKTLELNAELASKIEEMKELNERLKDKEYEVDLLNEDIAAFHEEIASLKDQLVIQTPSPRDGSSSNSDTTKKKSGAESDRQATNDKKELRKITKKVGLLQNELGLNKKELNIKAFELERAKLEVMELRNELEIMRNFVLDKDREIRDMAIESNALKDQLQAIADKIREDGNLDDLRQKLQSKCDECLALEREVELLKEVMDRMRSQSPADNRLAILAPGDVSALARPTMTRSSRRLSINEIEERLKHELDTSQKLDDSLLEQILVGREKEDDSALRFEGAKRSLPITAEQLIKLTSDNEHLKKQASVLEERIRDKDVLIQELNSIREGLMRDLQIAEARFEDERDNGERIQLLLDSERNTSKNLQDQDANMIQVLKSRLESALDSKSELETSFKEEQDIRKNLDKQLKSKRDRHTGGDELIRNLEERLEDEMEKSERLLSEVQLLRAKRSTDKERLVDLQHILDREKSAFQLEGEKSSTALNVVRAQVVEMRRKERSLQSELNHTKTQLQLRAAEVDSLHDRMDRIKSHSGRSLDYATSELADQNSKLNKQKLDLINEVHLLKEKLSTLRQSRKENPVYSSTTVLNIHDDADTENQVRHLYRCYIRVESFRKALVHQKKFLLSGLGSMALLNLQLKPNKRKSFRSVVFGILAISRLRYLVRRWHSGRKLGDCLFSRATVYPSQKKPQHSRTSNQQHSSKPYQVSSSPPCRERSSTRRSASREASQANLLGGNSGQGSPLQPHSDSTCVYRDVLGVYANPELFSGTITINERKRFESRAKEDDNSQLHTPSVNLDPNATLNRYLQRLDETTKLVKRALDTPRSTH